MNWKGWPNSLNEKLTLRKRKFAEEKANDLTSDTFIIRQLSCH